MYKKRRKKVEKRKIILIILLIIALILGFVANVVKTDRQLTVFEKTIKDGVIFINKIVSYPIDAISNVIYEKNEKNKMYNEYENMKKELESLDSLSNENKELKLQLEDMKKLLELNNSLSEYETINATVVGRDLGFWYETITIDKGEKNGVIAGMPVMVSEGLIGKVISVSTFNSTVRLITANNSNDKISVKINTNDNSTYGILTKYNKDSNTYTIEGIPQNMNIEKGLTVTTTGLGDSFPSGIVVGVVEGINTDNFDLAKVLEIKSLVNFDKINYVTVLKRSAIE